MGWDADTDIGRTMLRRVELVSTKDDKGEQYLTAKGFANEQFKDLLRLQLFGSSSHAPKGSRGIVMMSGGRDSRGILLGMEHEDHRPKNKAEGDHVLYDAHGNTISMISGKVRHVSALHEFVGNFKITGAMEFNGDITHAGNMNTSGVHVDSNGPHTA